RRVRDRRDHDVSLRCAGLHPLAFGGRRGQGRDRRALPRGRRDAAAVAAAPRRHRQGGAARRGGRDGGVGRRRGKSAGQRRDLACARSPATAAGGSHQSYQPRGPGSRRRTGLTIPYRPQGGRPMLSLATIALLAIFVVIILFSAVRILREYGRGVVFQLRRYTVTKGPGFFLLVPLVQQMVRVDLRVVVDEVPTQDVISRDNVSVKVNAVIYFRVVDAERAVIQVYNYLAATSQLAQTTLRWVLGKHDLDQMLAERDKQTADTREGLDKKTEGGGNKVSTVKIRRIDLDESMTGATPRKAEAERTRRAKIINAEGEQQAAQKLLDAAQILAPVPQA